MTIDEILASVQRQQLQRSLQDASLAAAVSERRASARAAGRALRSERRIAEVRARVAAAAPDHARTPNPLAPQPLI